MSARPQAGPRPAVDELLATGVQHQQAGRLDDAEASFRAVLTEVPGHLASVQLLAVLLIERNEPDEAIELLRSSVRAAGPASTDNLSVYNNLANALRRAERYGEAEEILRDLVRIAPREWQPWHNLAQVLKETDRLDESVAAIRRAIALQPEYGPNHGVLGEVLHKVGRLRSSRAALEKCAELGWDRDPDLWTVLANTNRQLGDMPGAIAALEHALELAPTATAHSNMGITLGQAGRFDDALEHYAIALELEPESPNLRANRGYTRLTAGDIVGGWEDWEYAIQDGPRGNERVLGVPRWTPERTTGTVMAWREQGVGDEILFASCYPDLLATAEHVIIECDRRLDGLFARSFPAATVRAQTLQPLVGETMIPPDFDSAIPVGSLPRHFRSSVDAFPTDGAYLSADPERVFRWRERLASYGKPVVGISWRSRVQTAERRLEYTRLHEWGEIFAIPDVTWVTLQYDDTTRELSDAERRFGVEVRRWEWLDLMNDFEEVAALMTCCDLVLAPRNAVAMLGGALGRPTVMMGNRWDWSDLGTDTCPWLPSVELVYRHHGDEWDDVLAHAATRVRALTTRTNPDVADSRPHPEEHL